MNVMFEVHNTVIGNHRLFAYHENIHRAQQALSLLFAIFPSSYAIGLWIEQPNNMWGLHTLITREVQP